MTDSREPRLAKSSQGAAQRREGRGPTPALGTALRDTCEVHARTALIKPDALAIKRLSKHASQCCERCVLAA